MANKNRTALNTVLSLYGAENEARTRDPQLGKLMLYQLSYFRIVPPRVTIQRPRLPSHQPPQIAGAKVQYFLKPTHAPPLTNRADALYIVIAVQ